VQAIPPNLDPREVLDKYLTEQTTSQIAQSYGISRKSLVAWLRQVMPAEWKHVQIVRALVRKDDGNDGFETAEDALSLARAREMVKSAQFDLERLDSPTWGQTQQVVHSGTVNISHALQEISQRRLARSTEPAVIDVVPEQQDKTGDA